MRAKTRVTVLLTAAACGVATFGVGTVANAAPMTSSVTGPVAVGSSQAVDAAEAARIAESQAARRAAGRGDVAVVDAAEAARIAESQAARRAAGRGDVAVVDAAEAARIAESQAARRTASRG